VQRLFEELRRVDLAGPALDAEKAQEERAGAVRGERQARELAALESYRTATPAKSSITFGK